MPGNRTQERSFRRQVLNPLRDQLTTSALNILAPTTFDGSSAATLATTLFHTLEKNVGKFLAALLITSVPIPLEIKVSHPLVLAGKIFFSAHNVT